MSESFIEPEPLNTTFQNLSAIVDSDGTTKFLNPELSSYNFDGFIPLETETIKVNQLQPGMLFLPVGASVGALRAALKVEFDDPEMTDSPTTDYIISYLGQNGDIESVVYDSNDDIDVYFEDWESKVLGSTGWTITQAGNAIFSNVAVRGRIEALEGLIEGELIVEGSFSTSETADTTGGIVFDSTGIFAYDPSGNNTFLLDAETGDITIFGTPGDDLLTGEDVSDGGATTISANRITTGSVTGRVFRSNSTMTPTSGTGVYLDGDGRVRFSDPDATFTFDSSGLNVTSTNATMTFNSTGLSISGAGVSIGGTVQIDGSNANALLTGTDVGPSGTTTISGDRITTGSIESSAPDFIWNGISTFSTQGTRFSVNDGQIISEQFRVDSAGNAFFSGNLSAAGGTFSGTLSANSITSGSINASVISVTNLNATNITTGTITGREIRTSSGNNRITMSEATSSFGADAFNFYSGGARAASFYYVAGDGGGGITTDGRLTAATAMRTFGPLYVGGNTLLDGTSQFNGAADAQTSFVAAFSGANRAFRVGSAGGVFSFGIDDNTTAAAANVRIGTSAQLLRSTSTVRLKDDLVPTFDDLAGVDAEKISDEPASIDPHDVLLLTPTEFASLSEADSGARMFGFIAEDVAVKLPWAANWDEEGLPSAVEDRPILAALLAVVREQQAAIEDLSARVAVLEG